MKRLLFYVSGHGYGHAARMAPLIEAIGAAADSPEIHVRTDAPVRFFPKASVRSIRGSSSIDVGMLQSSPLDIDLPATLAAHQEFCRNWEAAVEREARLIRKLRPNLVVADVPPLAAEASGRADVPCVAVSNFSWDVILDEYAGIDPRWRPIVERYRKAYGLAKRLFRLPLHGPAPAFREVKDMPLLAARSTLSREEVRRRMRIDPDDPRAVVLISFGGFGHFRAGGGRVFSGKSDDLSDFLFLAFGPKPEGLRAGWMEMPQKLTKASHADLVRGADVVLGKPGYGTFAEALAQRTRMLYVPRDDYREGRWLAAGMEAYGICRRLERSDFLAGRWRAGLAALLSRPSAWADLPSDGAERIAAELRRISGLS